MSGLPSASRGIGLAVCPGADADQNRTAAAVSAVPRGLVMAKSMARLDLQKEDYFDGGVTVAGEKPIAPVPPNRGCPGSGAGSRRSSGSGMFAS